MVPRAALLDKPITQQQDTGGGGRGGGQEGDVSSLVMSAQGQLCNLNFKAKFKWCSVIPI